jgi:microcystin-dependent protein
MNPFGTGSGVGTTYATCLLTFPDVDWFKWNIVGAINQMTLDFNWSEDGDVAISFAVEESQKTLESMIFMAFNPIPIGLIHPFASATIPEGFLLCDGTTLDTADYPELFAVIGYSFGGSGSAFLLPDLIDRTIIGSSGTFALGDTGGAIDVTLDVSQIPAHTHTDAGHAHSIPLVTSLPAQAGVGFAGDVTVPVVTSSTGVGFANNQNTGGDGAHNNMQPFMSLTYIIYAGR